MLNQRGKHISINEKKACFESLKKNANDTKSTNLRNPLFAYFNNMQNYPLRKFVLFVSFAFPILGKALYLLYPETKQINLAINTANQANK